MKLPTDQTAFNRLRIGSYRKAPGLSGLEKKQKVFAVVYTDEVGYGTQLVHTHDERVYAVLGQSGEILPMPQHNKGGDRMFAYLFQMYGLDRTDQMTTAIYENLRSQALSVGLRVELRRFAAYDKATMTTYLSNYNGSMWKLDGEGIEKMQSGTDGVFFIDDDRGTPVEPEYGDNGVLFEKLVNLNFEEGPGGITAEQQKRFMIVWLFAHAFPDLLPDKPIMLLEGQKGSGKTLAPLLIQHTLLGTEPKAMSITEDQKKDFGVLLLRAPIAVLDNMDSYMEWIQNQICIYATNGTFPRRKLFSDDDEITVKPESFIAITSRNPSSFRRDDVVDRLLIIRLKRYNDFRAVEKIMSEIRALRPKLYGEYCFYVNKIIEALRNDALEDRQERWRMASFAAFTRVVGKVMSWTVEEVNAMLDAMQQERDIFEGEGDPLVEIMSDWIVYRVKGQPSSIGREFSLSELFKSFSSIAERKGVPFYKHHSRLAEKLESAYVARHFRVEIRHDNSTNMKYVRIWRITDPDLGVVDDPVMDLSTEGDPKIRIIRIAKT